MNNENSVLRNEEKAVFALRSLYGKYGYSRYKMSKFEEYDLYVRNKDFLVSDNIITFTDTDGKLMALKPDVTLSIIKNTKDEEGTKKLYYNENVYRVSKGTNSFKEIMQLGLECIGTLDTYSLFEVMYLAAMSLKTISEDFLLDISNIALVSGILEELSLSREDEKAILKCLGEKNPHGIKEILNREKIEDERLLALSSLSGLPSDVIPELESIFAPDNKALTCLKEIAFALENAGLSGKINIDFSVTSDMAYYNGFVFKGFIKGIPEGILSGGQYDKLMKKMGKKSGAIGFAVYLDSLYYLSKEDMPYDVDALILYDDKTSLSALSEAVALFTSGGKSCAAFREIPKDLRYRQLLKMNEKGVEIIENNA